MNKAELKKILKPLIKECIKEVIFEDGTLSTIISEVVKGTTSQNVVYENKKPENYNSHETHSRKQAQLNENRRKMLDAIGRDSMNGVNIFEGTDPLSSSGEIGPGGPKNALSGVDPTDSGVDISDLAGIFGDTWKVIKNG